MTKILSIVSGKGGSGKSLLTAVLGRAVAVEGQRVLLIDMDIFVRGLTVLLSTFRRPKAREGRFTTSDLLGIFSTQSKTKGPPRASYNDLLIQRFFECDILPAVDNVSSPLDYDDKSLSDEGFCRAALSRLLKSVSDEYDYIFIDNRAGMDSLIAASCKLSDMVLCVAEDDEVGRQTNVNLVRFVQSRGLSKSVYSIINKGRGVRTLRDIEARHSQRSDFGVLGVIPFDMEVLEGFGREDFWSTVTGTLYFQALLRSWNQLNTLEDVAPINKAKYRFAPSIFMSAGQGRFNLPERMLRIYSSLFIVFGASMWLFDRYTHNNLSSSEAISFFSILLGIVALMMSTSFSQFLRSDSRRDRNWS